MKKAGGIDSFSYRNRCVKIAGLRSHKAASSIAGSL